MVLEQLAVGLPEDTLSRVHTLITIFQAIGGLIIAYLVFNIVNIIFGRKNRNEFKRMRNAVESIDRKLDKIIKNKKNK